MLDLRLVAALLVTGHGHGIAPVDALLPLLTLAVSSRQRSYVWVARWKASVARPWHLLPPPPVLRSSPVI